MLGTPKNLNEFARSPPVASRYERWTYQHSTLGEEQDSIRGVVGLWRSPRLSFSGFVRDV